LQSGRREEGRKDATAHRGPPGGCALLIICAPSVPLIVIICTPIATGKLNPPAMCQPACPGTPRRAGKAKRKIVRSEGDGCGPLCDHGVSTCWIRSENAHVK
jgi:hypothetical protein